MSDVSLYAQRLLDALEPAIGKHTARRALDLACKKTDHTPASLGASDHAAVADVLGPMLRTLVGRAKADRILQSMADAAG